MKKIIYIFSTLILIFIFAISCSSPGDPNANSYTGSNQTVFTALFQNGTYPYSSFDKIFDAYISSMNPTTTYNNFQLNIGRSTSYIYRSLIEFDLLGTMSPNINIIKAELTLFISGSSAGADLTINAHLLNVPWSDDSVTWDRPKTGESWTGGDYDSEIIGQARFQASSNNRFVTIELDTDLVKTWLTSYESSGILLKSSDDTTGGTNYTIAYSSDFASKGPMLTIYYIMP